MSGSHPTLWHIERLALQREGALGARPQGRRASAPGPAAGRPHPGRALAHPRRPARPSRCSSSTGAGSATRPRSSPRSRSATPSPPLYPADPEQRRRALELEEFFDEELGPHIRLLAFHELRQGPRALPGADRADRARRRLRGLGGAAASYARAYTSLRFGVRDAEAADRAREKILAALDRLEARARGRRRRVPRRRRLHASPTSPRPRSSTRSSSPTRGRCRPTSRRPRAWSASARR